MTCNIILIQWPKQWKAEACIKLIKRTMKKYYKTNVDTYMSLLQIRSTPIIPKIPSLATILFNRLVKGLLPRISSPPIMFDNDESNHAAVKKEPSSLTQKETDTPVNISLLPAGSTVAVQDRGPWMHETIIRHGSEDPNKRCYKIRLKKTGCIITRTKQHMAAFTTSTEDYLRTEIMKGRNIRLMTN